MDNDGPPDCVECHSPCGGVGHYFDEYDAYACASCGDIEYRENIMTTSRGTPLLTGGDETDFVRFVGTVVLDDVEEGPLAIVKMPFDAKDDFKDLEFRKTERRWSDDVNNWVILDRTRTRAAEHMRDSGWQVVDLVELSSRGADAGE